MSVARRLAFLLFLLISTAAHAQGTRADYERADALPGRLRNKVVGGVVKPHWSPDGSRFWYRRDLAHGGQEYIGVDVLKGLRAPAFDHGKVAEALTKAVGKPVTATHLLIDRMGKIRIGSLTFEGLGKAWHFDEDSNRLEQVEAFDGNAKTIEIDGTPWRFDSGSDTLEALKAERGPNQGRSNTPRSRVSPDDQKSIHVKNFNLYLRDRATGEEHALSDDGREEDRYEEGVFWSPDSKRLVALKTSKGDVRKVNLIESTPRDQIQPRLESYEYPKPGDRLPISKPRLFDVATRKAIPIEDDLFKNPFSLSDVHWSSDATRFRFVYNQRGHQVVRVISVDAETGTASVLIGESSPTFVDYSQKFMILENEETKEILSTSERDGWNHLYRFDAETGQRKHQVTKGEWVVRGIDRIDPKSRQIWFHASGIWPGQDPYYLHYARTNFDGSGLTILTEGDGTHSVAFSPDCQFLIDTYSRVDLPPVVELRSTDTGSLICELERADASALVEAGWRAPERFVAKGRDGKTDIFGVIYRPTNFDSTKKYPVIEQIYAGPHGAHVPKAFAAFHGSQALAELGFIVVQIDGMGTNWRSKAFHDVCWKNLADAGFPDRILWIKAAAAHDPALDLTRVGLYGGSAGGQNALGGLLWHGDFYKAAVADCGCHDNRMDKIWWNEAWMGWPVGPEYAASSNVTNAYRLRGKLLLTVGELDHNVDPASTMQVVNALIKAGKDFELIVFPGAGHGAGSNWYGQRRLRDFFVRNLLGVEPPDWNRGE